MIISIISGKGGTGKTTIAVNLALSAGKSVSLVDCDVEGPNAGLLLHLSYHYSRVFTMKVPDIDRIRCTLCGICADTCAYNALAVMNGTILLFPEQCHSCLGCADQCPEKAISFRERPAGKIEKADTWDISGIHQIHFLRGEALIDEHRGKFLIRALKEKITGGGDAILDGPPGTVLASEAMRGTHLSLIIAEPTPFGLSDLARMFRLTESMNIPASVLINKSKGDDRSIEEFCAAHNLAVIGTLPLDPSVAHSYAQGSAITGKDDRYRTLFGGFYHKLELLYKKEWA